MTTGLRLRWSVAGPYMCNILGGGGGKEGFKHLLEHLGPATLVWTKDMNANAFQWTTENKAKLDESVQKWLGKVDIAAIEAERDNALIDMVKMKSEHPALT